MTTEYFASHIPYGKEKAVSRNFLSMLFGISDREVRKMVQKSRNDGYIIINDQNGGGYYQSDNIDDIARQYRQNRHRALSILKSQKHLRKRLKEAGRIV